MLIRLPSDGTDPRDGGCRDEVVATTAHKVPPAPVHVAGPSPDVRTVPAVALGTKKIGLPSFGRQSRRPTRSLRPTALTKPANRRSKKDRLSRAVGSVQTSGEVLDPGTVSSHVEVQAGVGGGAEESTEVRRHPICATLESHRCCRPPGQVWVRPRRPELGRHPRQRPRPPAGELPAAREPPRPAYRQVPYGSASSRGRLDPYPRPGTPPTAAEPRQARRPPRGPPRTGRPAWSARTATRPRQAASGAGAPAAVAAGRSVSTTPPARPRRARRSPPTSSAHTRRARPAQRGRPAASPPRGGSPQAHQARSAQGTSRPPGRAHWCTLFLSVVVDRPPMHPRCCRVIALLA